MRQVSGWIAAGVIICAMAWSQEARAGYVSSTPERTRKRLVLPHRILIKKPCHTNRYTLIAEMKRQFEQFGKKYCKRFPGYTASIGHMTASSFTPAAKGRYCYATMKYLSSYKPYCYKPIRRGAGYFVGTAYGKVRMRKGQRPVNTARYCRTAQIMRRLRLSAKQRATKIIKRHCLGVGYLFKRRLFLLRYIELKNISRKKNTYICSARFWINFICDKEALH